MWMQKDLPSKFVQLTKCEAVTTPVLDIGQSYRNSNGVRVCKSVFGNSGKPTVTLGLELASRVVEDEIRETHQSQEVNGINLKMPVS